LKGKPSKNNHHGSACRLLLDNHLLGLLLDPEEGSIFLRNVGELHQSTRYHIPEDCVVRRQSCEIQQCDGWPSVSAWRDKCTAFCSGSGDIGVADKIRCKSVECRDVSLTALRLRQVSAAKSWSSRPAKEESDVGFYHVIIAMWFPRVYVGGRSFELAETCLFFCLVW
jgi:hypothetical protein